MSKQKIKIVTLIENDPILGVKYGEQTIVLNEDTQQQTKYVEQYNTAKSRNQQLMNKSRTTQK